MLLSPDEHRLYVTLANRDAVAVIDTGTDKVGALSRYPAAGTAVRRQLSAGAGAISGWQAAVRGQWIFGCGRCLRLAAKEQGIDTASNAAYFIPTEWYPTALAIHGNELFVATGKGIGTGPNSALLPHDSHAHHGHPYIASLIHGSVARIDLTQADKERNTADAGSSAQQSHDRAGTASSHSRAAQIPFITSSTS